MTVRRRQRSALPGVLKRLLESAAIALLAAAAFTAPLALAQGAGPGRVGRVVELTGVVQTYDAEARQWTSGAANRPVTTGDRLWVPDQARAEVRVGSTSLRLGGGTEMEAVRIDDGAIWFRLHRGRVALRVAAREVAAEIEVATAEAQLLPQRAGHFRIERSDAVTFASAWRGELRVGGEGGFEIAPGRRAELWREARTGALRHAWLAPVDDEFSAWAQFLDRNDERDATTRVVSNEITGAEDLDRYGRWERHPEFGSVWIPLTVAVGWEPFRHGRWTWIRPWGWTWIDDAPWGFAPFHYGRWASWNGRWCWVPGHPGGRPAFHPAPVTWVGGHRPHDRHTRPGQGGVTWTPLLPHDPHPGHGWSGPDGGRRDRDRDGRPDRHDGERQGRDRHERNDRHGPSDRPGRPVTAAPTTTPAAPLVPTAPPLPAPHRHQPMPHAVAPLAPAAPPPTRPATPQPSVAAPPVQPTTAHPPQQAPISTRAPAADHRGTPPAGARERNERERDDSGRARAPESRPGSRDRNLRQ